MKQQFYTIQAKVTNASPEIKSTLWETHQLYNYWLKIVIADIFKLIRLEDPRSGPISKTNNQHTKEVIRDIILAALKSKNKINYYSLFNNFATSSAKTEKGQQKPNKTATTLRKNDDSPNFQEQLNKIYDDINPYKYPVPQTIPQRFNYAIVTRAFIEIKTWYGLKKYSKKERNKQKTKLKKFINDHPQYKQLTKIMEQWEQQNGAAQGNRRYKNAKYLEMLLSGQLGEVETPDKPTVKKVLRTNPELSKFDRFYQKYKRLSKIDKPASYSAPHPTKHPRWVEYTCNSPQIIKNFGDNKVNIQTIAGWTPISFSGGSRFNNYTDSNNTNKNLIIDNDTYTIKSIKTRFPNNDQSEIYLDIVIAIEGKPKQESQNNILYTGVDLGWANPAYCVCVHHHNNKFNIVATRNIKINNRFENIQQLSKRISHKQSKTRKIKGYKHQTKHITMRRTKTPICPKLTAKRRNMLDDYCKQLASKIVKLTQEAKQKTGADHAIISLEDLVTLQPKIENPKYANTRLSKMAPGKIKEAIESAASKQGISISTMAPAGTSKTCNRCGSIGTRYNNTDGKIERAKCGRLFACSTCGLTNEDSDKNAAINLVKLAIDPKWLKEYKTKYKGTKGKAELSKISSAILQRVKDESAKPQHQC